MDYRPFRRLSVLSALAKDIVKNPNDMDLLKQLKEHIQASSKQYMEATEKICMPCCFSYIKGLSAGTLKLSSEGKLLLMETLNDLFWKISISNEVVFFNFYTYILVELYDYDTHEVKKVSEEYKNSSLKSMIALMSNIPFELIEEIYSKRNIPKFSQIIYVCTQCIRNETARNLRLTSVNCILAVARVLDDKDLDDKVLRYTCSEMFMFFLPGLSGALTDLALEDVKVGHIIVMNAVRAYGKLVTLVMTDYNGADGRINLSDFNLLMLDLLKEPKKYMFNKKLKGKEEIEEYLSETSKNIKWYRKTDEMLNITMKKLAKLTYHSHDKVRLELAYAASDLIKNCSNTMPDSSSTLVEHLIVLSHDESREIAEISEKSIEQLSKNLSEDHLKVLFESLEDGFYNAIMSLPWKFNSIDNGEKITILNLLIGYLKLFGKYNMHHVMLKTHIIHNLVKELLRITELEKNTISLLEVYTLKELSSDCTFKRPWLNFHFFQEEIVKVKIEILCAELSKYNCFNEICRELLNTYLMEKSMKKEAAYLINSLISGLEGEEQQHYMTTLNEILKVYVDDPSNDDLHVALKLQQKRPEQLKDQIIVVCLITEGIGVISRVLKRKFQPFLLKTLYLVLEKAGSDHPLIRTAGLLTLQNLTRSNGYNEITDLINSNFDYFSFHVQRKLGNALGSKDTVLNVLSVVLQYCNVDVLMPMKNIIEEVIVLFNLLQNFLFQYSLFYIRSC
ncbi:hypothetical protein ABEB36_012364 [Hypothenemus hampei]|uniref:TTI1 N-terminal TPR domain-containing protein n=1 Tax=Hypothenemus hampei TaxID=57062 RepID=A0ABD1EAY2_HYPHA